MSGVGTAVEAGNPLVGPSGQIPNYLRPEQAASIEAERESLEKTLATPGTQEPGVIHAQLRKIRQQLATQMPPDLSPEQRSKVAAREKQLAEYIADGLPSRDEMMRNPAGTAYRALDHERKKKKAILEWKACRLALNKGNPDATIASIERLRAERNPLVNYDGSQIDRKAQYSFPSEQFAKNYDEVFRKEAAELKAENERLKAELAEAESFIAEQTAPQETDGRRRSK